MNYSSRATVYHNLALMTNAGLPLRRAIKSLADGSKFGLAVSALTDSMNKGSTMAQAMLENRSQFDKIDIMLVEAGENSGELDLCFAQLSNWYAMKHRVRRTIVSGLYMPILVLHIAVLLVSLTRFFQSHFDPAVFISTFFSLLSMFYFPVISFFVIIKLKDLATAAKTAFDYVLIYLPGFKTVFRNHAIAKFTRAFHTLYKAGIPITQCVEHACLLTGNAAVARWFQGGIRATKEGNPVSTGFTRDPGLDYLCAWENGEESGSLDIASEHLAKTYEDRAQYGFEQMAFWIPKIAYFIILIILAGMVMAGFSSLRGQMGSY